MNNNEVKTMVRYNHRVFSGDGKTLHSEVMQEFATLERAASSLNELIKIDKNNEHNRSLWTYTNDGAIVSWSFQCRDYKREVTYWEITLD